MPDIVPAPGRLPSGTRVYAIGDVHGCLSALLSLHDKIRRDLAERPVPDSLLVHVGDYVDRGQDSRGVVDLLVTGPDIGTMRRVDLMGNHEQMMLRALRGDSRSDARLWLVNGGDETLASYAAEPRGGAEQWREVVPPAHRLWLLQRPCMHKEGGYVFVHAGLRPGRAIEAQTEEDLLWIREPFLSDQTPRDIVAVHGHTPVADPEIRCNRIGIDTGAVMGGRLTCVVLEDDGLFFLSA